MIKFLFFLLTIQAYATDLGVVATKDDFEKSSEFLAIMAKIKTYGEFRPKPVEEVKAGPTRTAMSRGQQAVEEAKARNRAILATQKKEETNNPESSQLDQWKAEVKKTQDGWKKEILEQRREWQKEQKIFLGRLKEVKANTFTIPVKVEKIIEKKIPEAAIPDVHIVNGTFKVPIRNQMDRPTCSAFAGVRSMEILLAQNGRTEDLSEQYFYWASKPKCQTSPCRERGSWIPLGLDYSKRQMQVDIPGEQTCAYSDEGQEDNETQVPLLSGCKQGLVKVVNYEEVRTISEMVEKLKANIPVIMAAKLTENFYVNEGVVFLSEGEKSPARLDSHSKGHAMLAVGLIELPEKIRAKEGSFCIVVANSWGEGWGSGGYSCLSENWLTKYRQPSPFFAVTKIAIR